MITNFQAVLILIAFWLLCSTVAQVSKDRLDKHVAKKYTEASKSQEEPLKKGLVAVESMSENDIINSAKIKYNKDMQDMRDSIEGNVYLLHYYDSVDTALKNVSMATRGTEVYVDNLAKLKHFISIEEGSKTK